MKRIRRIPSENSPLKTHTRGKQNYTVADLTPLIPPFIRNTFLPTLLPGQLLPRKVSLRRELHKNADYSRSTRAIIHAANYQLGGREGGGGRERRKKRQRESISQTGLNPRERRGQRFSLTFELKVCAPFVVFDSNNYQFHVDAEQTEEGEGTKR